MSAVLQSWHINAGLSLRTREPTPATDHRNPECTHRSPAEATRKRAIATQRRSASNAVAEGMNSRALSNKRRVGGFRNRQNFKIAIFFPQQWPRSLPPIIPDAPEKQTAAARRHRCKCSCINHLGNYPPRPATTHRFWW